MYFLYNPYLSSLINSLCWSIFMILMLTFSSNSMSTTPLCVAVNTSKGSESFRFSICTYFRTISMILFILVRSGIFSSNQANTEFEQVLVTFTFTSCLIFGLILSKLRQLSFYKHQDSSGCHRRAGPLYHLWTFFVFVRFRPLDASSAGLLLVLR